MNRYKGFSLGAAASFVAIIASCGGNSDCNSAADSLSLESYAYDVISLTTDSVGFDLEGADRLRSQGEGILPVAKEGEPLMSLRDSLMKLAGVEFDQKGKAYPLPTEGFELSTEPADSTDACNYSINKLTITLVTPRVAVWSNETSFYPCGAAHPMSATTYVNYDRTNHRILSLSDLMKDGYQKALAQLLREKLQEMNIDLLVDIDSVEVPEIFNLTNDGISFTYGLYSIAPYSSGEVKVNLSAWELSDVLTNEGYNLIMDSSF